MSFVRLHCVRGAGLTSDLIGYFGAGVYSHTDIVLPNGDLLGARADVIKGRDGNPIPSGVRVRPQNYEMWTRRTLFELNVTPQQHRAFYDYAHSQIGKPYDTDGIRRFIFNQERDWRDPASWWCSEFGVYCGEVAKVIPPIPLSITHITPGDCALIYASAGATVTEIKA